MFWNWVSSEADHGTRDDPGHCCGDVPSEDWATVTATHCAVVQQVQRQKGPWVGHGTDFSSKFAFLNSN